MSLKWTMEATRRIKQLTSIFQFQLRLHHHTHRLYSVTTAGFKGTSILKSTFADINSNLLTTEAKCVTFIEFYNSLGKSERSPFLCQLAKEYGIEKDAVLSVANGLVGTKEHSETSLLSASDRMRKVLRPKYKTLFTHIGRVDGGVKFLVDLRADILNLKKHDMDEMKGALYQELNSALRELLMLWFTVGFLNLERITWSSPCDLVQKVSEYEAVHRVKTWEDMKRRVGPYRRCYIFTHNSMPREPVVVLHTALTEQISSSIHTIIDTAKFRPKASSYGGEENSQEFLSHDATTPSMDIKEVPAKDKSIAQSVILPSGEMFTSMKEEKEDPSKIHCAIFYSITSTQKGLQGIEMGNYLIKTVVRKLKEEFPHLQQFSSLSPIPGFRDWLLSSIKHSLSKDKGENPGTCILLPEELSALAPFQLPKHQNPVEVFRDLVSKHQWYRNPALTEIVKAPLMRLCANYLYIQKRRNYALNPVANFHLSNGAVLWRINFQADTSHRGFLQSCSMMVNYRYFLESTESNSRNYLENYHIQATPSVLDLLGDS